MYRRRPCRRLGQRAKPAPAPRQRRDRIPPSEARRPTSRDIGATPRNADKRYEPEGRPLIGRPGKRLGRKFSVRKRGKCPMIGPEVLRAEARDVPTASPPSVREAGEARACAASAARPNSAERSEAERKPRSGANPRNADNGTGAPEGRPAPRSGACPDGALAVGRKRQRRGDVRHASSLPVPDHTFSLFETITGKPTKNKAIIQSELSLKRQN